MSIKAPTLISVSNSSIISRFNASCGVSPASILPPGNSQPSLNSPYPRWVAKIIGSFLLLTAFIIAAISLIIQARLMHLY